MNLVVLESPYAGDIKTHVTYARRAVCDALRRGEAPLASHLLYTQDGVLSDSNPADRRLGINAGHAWIRHAGAVVVYTDYGVSAGMERGIAVANENGIMIIYRTIGKNDLE